MTSRDRKILDLVTGEPIRTQRELVTALRRAGLRVSQATVSRDIKRLGLVKAPGPGGARYLPHGALNGTPPDAATRLARAFRDYVVGIEEGSGLILVKTTTGSADAVAEAIDEIRWPEIAGTVAGDNTILVVPRTSASRRRIQTRLEELIP